MLTLLLLVILSAYAIWFTNDYLNSVKPLSRRVSVQLQRLWSEAHKGIRERRYIHAEKALLAILRFDQKNAAAYNRLGILYTRQKEYKDAIHCFEIAKSIEPNASSLHNLGLIYYETGNYPMAERAFAEALEMEDTLAARHIAYAKVLEKLGKTKRMLLSLEKAVELEPNPQTYTLLMDAYMHNGNEKEAEEIRLKLNKLIMPNSRNKRRIRQPRRAIM